VFTGRSTGKQEGEGYYVTLELDPFAFNKNDTGRRVLQTLGDYIRAHVRSQGWRVKTVSFKKGYLELSFAPWRVGSKAASNRSKNRSARV
jgi:hypothetical protein